MSGSLEALARDEADASAARTAIWSRLDTVEGCREAYAALSRWAWRVMVEHRVDDELRAWHRLLGDVAARMASVAPSETPTPTRLEPAAAAERIRALADLVRLSVEASDAADLTTLMGRTHVPELLRLLAKTPDAALPRETIKAELGLGNANLSRVLTLLVMNGLIERRTAGKAAAFQITSRGLETIGVKPPRFTRPSRHKMVVREAMVPVEGAKSTFGRTLGSVMAVEVKVVHNLAPSAVRAGDAIRQYHSPVASAPASATPNAEPPPGITVLETIR
ncbi:MAG: hypothetical protein AB1698_10220 [Pseudomonadota bacterium]